MVSLEGRSLLLWLGSPSWRPKNIIFQFLSHGIFILFLVITNLDLEPLRVRIHQSLEPDLMNMDPQHRVRSSNIPSVVPLMKKRLTQAGVWIRFDSALSDPALCSGLCIAE
jgi:hypothetical protein